MSDHKLNPFARGTTVPSVVLDRYGRELHEGAEVVLATTHPVPPFRVLKIAPALDPKLPPGTLYVDFICRWRFVAGRNTPVPEFLLVRSAEEAGVIAHKTEAEAEAAAPQIADEGVVSES
jgi:hypothetical protein